MQATRPTKARKNEFFRIVALIYGDKPNRLRHVLIRYINNAQRRLLYRQAYALGQRFYAYPGFL